MKLLKTIFDCKSSSWSWFLGVFSSWFRFYKRCLARSHALWKRFTQFFGRWNSSGIIFILWRWKEWKFINGEEKWYFTKFPFQFVFFSFCFGLVIGSPYGPWLSFLLLSILAFLLLTLNAIIKDVITFSWAFLIVSGGKRMKKMREKKIINDGNSAHWSFIKLF